MNNNEFERWLKELTPADFIKHKDNIHPIALIGDFKFALSLTGHEILASRLLKLNARACVLMGTDVAWAEGVNAFLAGDPVMANPYAPLTEQHGLWSDGWCTAFDLIDEV